MKYTIEYMIQVSEIFNLYFNKIKCFENVCNFMLLNQKLPLKNKMKFQWNNLYKYNNNF